MKKLLAVVAALVVGVGVGAAGPAKAVVNCSPKIFDGSAAYDGTSAVTGTIDTGTDSLHQAPGCKSVSYGAIISYDSGGTQVVQSTASKGDGTSPAVAFSFSGVAADNGTICVALFSTKGNTIQDVAPTTADLSNPPTPVADASSPNGYSCSSSGWVAINPQGSSGGGVGGFSS
jgi:hypothetical protein